MKKILVFIDWYLPGYKAGGPVRSMANMIAALKNEFQFFVVCRDTDYLEKKPYPGIVPNQWNCLSENEQVYYISSGKLSGTLIKKLISSGNYDLIYINGIYSFYFSILPLIYSKNLKNKKVIVAPRGMLSQQAYSAKKLKKKVFLAFAKLGGLYRNTLFHTTSHREKEDVQLYNFPLTNTVMLPNLAPFLTIKNQAAIHKQSGDLKLVSMARISPEKNTLFALQTLLSQQYNGNIRYDIFGSVYNKLYWKQCLDLISRLPENIEVVYKGSLNNDQVITTLGNYHFLFLPTTGENFGHSILEAFIAGCPVIISNKTPWKNLEEKGIGWDIELDKGLFAGAIQKALILDNQNYDMMAEKSRIFALKTIDNKDLINAYKKIFV